jgi:Ca2+-binding EF-hand superfamily protein
MAANLATTAEMEEMRQLFSKLDSNHDGVLSEKEILEGFINMDVAEPM